MIQYGIIIFFPQEFKFYRMSLKLIYSWIHVENQYVDPNDNGIKDDGGGVNLCFMNKCFEAIIDFFRRFLDYESCWIHYHFIYDIS